MMADQPYHVIFVDSDDEELPEVDHACPAAPISPTPFAAFRCTSTIRTDYDTKDQCYVLQLIYSPQLNIVAATLSNYLVKLFAFRDSGLQFVGQLQGHTKSIRDSVFSIPEEPYIIHTSSSDGTVRGWDVRSGQQVELYNTGHLEILSCHSNGVYVAAGASDKVLIWDRRTQKPAASFSDTHAQDVTQVRFHPEQRNVLVTASEDGFIAVFDTSNNLDEDEGFLAGLNITTAPAKIGFYGPQNSKLWCCSSTETLHLWEWAAACEEMSEGGNGPLGEAIDARNDLSSLATAAGLASADNDAMQEHQQPAIDYLIGCEPVSNSIDGSNTQLLVAAGNIAGSVAFFPVIEPPFGNVGGLVTFGPARATLTSGHTDIVRGVLWPGCSESMCLSGGEDGRICVWGSSNDTGSIHQEQPTSSGSEGVMRRQGQATQKRASPYGQ